MQTKEEDFMQAFNRMNETMQLMMRSMMCLLSETEESFRRQIQVFLQNPAFQEPKKND